MDKYANKGTFKFVDFLCEKDQHLFCEFYRRVEGTAVYFPKCRQSQIRFMNRRNRSIRRMFFRLKKLGLNDMEAYCEIQLRNNLARKLAINTIRAIVKQHQFYKVERGEI